MAGNLPDAYAGKATIGILNNFAHSPGVALTLLMTTTEFTSTSSHHALMDHSYDDNNIEVLVLTAEPGLIDIEELGGITTEPGMIGTRAGCNSNTMENQPAIPTANPKKGLHKCATPG